MAVRYSDDADSVTADQLRGFFVGWPTPVTPARHLELMRSSTHVIVAYDGERVVGFATAMSDGLLSAYIPLLEVLPEYHRRGIGTELLRRLLSRLDGYYMVDVVCDEELVPFYERLGLSRVGIAVGLRRRSALRTAANAVFDDVVIVDWSAASRPKLGRDSIWVGHAGELDSDPVNLATRGQAQRAIADRLVELARRGRRVLIGFDFPYGFPRGTAEQLELTAGEDDAPWLLMWTELARTIADGPTNANNRFDVAAALNRRGANFWGRPATSAANVPLTKPAFTLPEFRATEQRLRGRRLYPKSVWQLTGAGAVGSQALVGIPVVRALRFDPRLVDLSRVWPFETGFDLPRDVQIVHAEVWPGVVAPDASVHDVADARQVRTLARHLRDLPETDLKSLFAPGGDDAAALEEGWILGAV